MINFQVLERTTGWIVIDHEGDLVDEFETKEEAMEVVKKIMGIAELQANEK